MNKPSMFFLGWSGFTFATLVGLSFTLAIAKDPSRYMIQCSPESASFFSHMPNNLRPYLCMLYAGIRGLKNNKGAYSLTSRLVRFGVIFNTVLLFESHRQTSWIGRRATSIFTTLAHFLSGAVSAPLYFSGIYRDKEKLCDRSERQITAGEAWSVPLSVSFGYLLPLYLASKSGWTDAAITGMLPFPLYLSILNTLLPRILRPLLDGTSVRLATLCSMGISLIITASAPQLLLGPVSFKEVFWPPSSTAAPSFVRDLHILLLHDYIFANIGFLIYTTLRVRESQDITEKGFLRLAAVFTVLNQFDPASLVTMLWGLAEVRRARATDSVVDKWLHFEDDRQGGEENERQRLLESDTEE